MKVEEVERFEGVGRGVIGLLWLWKCVEKSKAGGAEAAPGAPDSLSPRVAISAHHGLRLQFPLHL